MATNKENLERWLLIDALVRNGNLSEIKRIAEKMIKELEDHKESKEEKKQDE